ncbi:helix-turn-helix domain-containing protein [Algimonas ampicilliniresistens]|nr:helix-turn-helix transcriptional regulator [Algimonas ampicilliniresistens]
MARLSDSDFTPSLCKAARALVGWTAQELADSTDEVAPRTLRKFENGGSVRDGTRDAIRAALEAAGVEFINGGRPGVRLIGNLSDCGPRNDFR